MIYLHKILPLLVSPIFIVIMIALCGVISRKSFFVLFSLALLYCASTQAIASRLYYYIERYATKVEFEQLLVTDAVVVLSGGVISSKGGAIDWGDPDRFFGGINLILQNKSCLLIFTGGRSPWDSKLLSEGALLREAATKFGVNKNNILVTGDVFNTEQEAREVRKLLGTVTPQIILVTSALHMPRAKLIFESFGFTVQPYPVDFRAEPTDVEILQILPRAEELLAFDTAVREMLGRIYYRLKYIKTNVSVSRGGVDEVPLTRRSPSCQND